jgi:flagellar biosynthesis/type III secretory pathway protein FliH
MAKKKQIKLPEDARKAHEEAVTQAKKEGYSSLSEKVNKPKTNQPIQTPTTEVKPTINLTPQKTGIAEFRERDTIAGKAVKVLSSPKTTVALGGILAGLLTMGGATGAVLGAGERAVITRTATMINKPLTSMTTQRAFVGRGTSATVNKLFNYSVNQKTIGLTKSLLTKTFTTIKNPAFIIGAIGSYPFANFVKEEALQTLSIPIMQALKEGDVETARTQITEVDKMLAEKNNLLDKIPYANVLKRLNEFFEAAKTSNDAWKNIISTAEQNAVEQANEPTFAEERATADEEARQRDLTEMQWKAEYYALIREGKFEEADELLQSQHGI